MSTPVNTDPRWRRVVQPSTYAYNSDTLAGASIVVEPEVSRMNDIARLIELCSLSSYPVGPLLNNDPSLQPVAGDFWKDNVFTWDSEEGSVWKEPTLFQQNFKRYAYTGGLLVAPLQITTEGEDGTLFSFWNYLIFDPDLKRIDRLDPHSEVKKDLDTAIKNFLAKYDTPTGILHGYQYHTPQETGTAYQYLVDNVVVPLECPAFVHYNMWAYWLLYVRLFFTDYPQKDVYDGVYAGLTDDVNAGNLLLNFYSDFTVDANLHAFGAVDFVIRYPSAKDLWRYEPALMGRVDRLTRSSSRSTQLNRVLSAAIRRFVTEGEGMLYRTVYKSFIGVDPLFAPKPDDCDGWVPKEEVDATLRAIFDGRELKLGYVLGAPYVYKDDAGNFTGLDYDLGKEITKYINDYYGTELVHAPVDVAPGIHDQSEDKKFTLLNDALKAGECHAALSGQLVMRGSDLPDPSDNPEWTCTTAIVFPAVTYTGNDDDKLNFDPVIDKTRQEFIDYIVKTYPKTWLSFFSVSNPGPSYLSATNLVRDINAAGGSAYWIGGNESQVEDIYRDRTYHFTVGDGIASGYLAKKYSKTAVYLNIPAVDHPSIFEDTKVNSPTLLPLAAFTLMES